MCLACWTQLRGALTDVADWLAEDLELTRTGRTKFTGAPIGRVKGWSERALPIRPAAAAIADQLPTVLYSWVRELWDMHAARWLACETCDAQWFGGEQQHAVPECTGRWDLRVEQLGDIDTTTAGLARWLLGHTTWIRTHPAAEDLHGQVINAYRAAMKVIDRPPAREYIGMCSAELEGQLCEVDLFASEDQDSVSCRGCGANWSVRDRRAWLSDAVDHQYLPPALVIAAVARHGYRLTMSMLRNYRARGRLTAYVVDPEFIGPLREQDDRYGWRVRPMVEQDYPSPLYLVADVVDVLNSKHRRTRLDK
ncbi:hypothetical protein EV192_101713 [Actinocrispum wychmicini]|uniref:Uncharacterized protein n=2 Tax=Actinocrispum wychmicini TaxID=1213861 RepID=A0A4R2K541_9PSEU|nr:hypothetical protein EV192_101713 [Actinocrispum wychmicini]